MRSVLVGIIVLVLLVVVATAACLFVPAIVPFVRSNGTSETRELLPA